jgi:hypothetical protein
LVNVHIHQFRNAGFREARQIFVDPTDFYRLFRFEA